MAAAVSRKAWKALIATRNIPRGTAEWGRVGYSLHFAGGSMMPPRLMKLIFTRLPANAPARVRPIARAICDKALAALVQLALRIPAKKIAFNLGSYATAAVAAVAELVSPESIVSFVRKSHDEFVVVIVNFTPVPRTEYRIGLPQGGAYTEILNSDSHLYGGSNVGNGGEYLLAEDIPWMDRPHSIKVTVPPLAAIVLKPQN